MKKIVVLSALLIFVATQTFAANFAPTLLKISAPSFVQYAFDGKEVKIPVKITGTNASVIFLVFTKDKASTINNVQNGYLGWHFVDKIDTCIYAGSPKQFGVGSNDIVWDGKNSDGKAVPEGEYDYYIWGFDNVNFKIPVTKQINPNPWGRITVMTKDVKGNILAKPIIWAGSDDRGGGGKDNTAPREHTNRKWTVGNDPLDATLMETCKSMEVCDPGGLAFLPTDYTYFFKCGLNNNGFKEMFKWKWIPNGDAVLQTDWGEDGKYVFAVAHPPSWEFGPGVVSDGGAYLLVPTGDLSGTGTESELIYVDVTDGTEVKRFDMSPWWVDLDDAEKGGQAASGPTELSMWGKYVVLGAHSTCVNMLFDVLYEEEGDAVAWVNTNGDYTGDHNFEETSAKPWVCNDYNVGPYKYNIAIEKNGFSFFPSFDMGAVSFGLYAPDGTGLGYQALAGETAKQKYDTSVISGGTAYDGLLVSNQSAEVAEERAGWFWVGQDSFKGIISSKPVAVEEAPADFAVAQNSPNPFNPTTTISFSIANAGNVTVDIYNVAGQKVDTIANEFMGAGSHSVVWDASGFSAGVYFYTVKSGDFAKTMKMTLLK
jgi:flagellar hook assembly protein FlgD